MIQNAQFISAPVQPGELRFLRTSGVNEGSLTRCVKFRPPHTKHEGNIFGDRHRFAGDPQCLHIESHG